MSAIEREIIEKLHQLQPAAQERVRDLIDQEIAAEGSGFDYAAWMRDAEALRQQIRADHGGKLPAIDVVGILRDIRDGEDE